MKENMLRANNKRDNKEEELIIIDIQFYNRIHYIQLHNVQMDANINTVISNLYHHVYRYRRISRDPFQHLIYLYSCT